MKLNFNTDKIITVCYPPYAGGKFLINCLALSRHATFQCKYRVVRDLKCKYRVVRDFNLDLNSISYYNSKLEMALESLPPDKQSMKKWRQYEFGCHQLFNWAAGSFCTKELSNDTVNNIIKLLSIRNDMNFFIVAHDLSSLDRIVNYFPNTKILMLTDFVDFMIKSTVLKNSESFNLENYKLDWNDINYSKYIDSFDKYKIDYTMSYIDIFEEDKFLDRVKILYDELGYDDFNRDLVQKFYQAYISLHI